MPEVEPSEKKGNSDNPTERNEVEKDSEFEPPGPKYMMVAGLEVLAILLVSLWGSTFSSKITDQIFQGLAVLQGEGHGGVGWHSIVFLFLGAGVLGTVAWRRLRLWEIEKKRAAYFDNQAARQKNLTISLKDVNSSQKERTEELGEGIEALQAEAKEQTSITSSLKKASTEQKEQLKDLRELLSTMPPRAFLSEYGTVFLRVQESIDDLEQLITAVTKAPAEAVKRNFGDDAADKGAYLERQKYQLIRTVLSAIASQTDIYTSRHNGSIYSANIMLFESKEEFAANGGNADDVTFYDSKGLADLKGVLRLDPELSATSRKTDAIKRDENVRPLILPIPVKPTSIGSDKIWNRVLPGAPYAFVEESASLFKDTCKMGEHCQKGDFSEDVTANVQKYMTEAAAEGRFRSLVSYPLYSGHKDRDLIGVLNIHSDETNMFKGEQHLMDFIAVMRPLIHNIETLLEKHIA